MDREQRSISEIKRKRDKKEKERWKREREMKKRKRDEKEKDRWKILTLHVHFNRLIEVIL